MTHFRVWVGEGDCEGLSFVMPPDVTFQTVLAAKRLFTAITRTVKWLLPFKKQTKRKPLNNKKGPIMCIVVCKEQSELQK